MASNEKVLIKRVIETVIQPNGKPKLVYNFGFFQATSHGGRQLVAVVEGSYEDAVLARKAPRTSSGNTLKGFKRLKDKSDA